MYYIFQLIEELKEIKEDGIKNYNLVKNSFEMLQLILFIFNIMFIKNNCGENKLWHIILNCISPVFYFFLNKLSGFCINL